MIIPRIGCPACDLHAEACPDVWHEVLHEAFDRYAMERAIIRHALAEAVRHGPHIAVEVLARHVAEPVEPDDDCEEDEEDP